MDEWLLLVHVLAGMVWIGGIVVLGAIGVRAVRDSDPDAPARFSATLRAIGPIALAPAPVLLVGFGVWLVADSPAWAFDQSWIQVGLGLFAAAFLVGAVHQSRTAIAAERAAARGDRDEAVRALRRWLWGTAVIVVLLVVAVWDMIFKPGL
jgi:uncharacterized membrane protein